jgi:hypothetical protein
MEIDVQWNELENKNPSRVRCMYPDEYYQWLIDTSEKLQKA